MPISLKKLCGRKLAASDGHIGHVSEFYFEDQRWAIRYVVADTGSWMPGRLVLISPYAFGRLDHCGDCLPINLTRKQIQDSPAAELHKPISRQYEERYHAYYQWPPYWNGGGLWGVGSYPTIPPFIGLSEQASTDDRPLSGDDAHLRSTRAVTGYDVQTSDGVIGQVTDFLVDEYSWMIRYLVISTGSWFSTNEIQISPKDVARISYAEGKVYVTLSRESILSNPDCRMATRTMEDSAVNHKGN